MKVMAYVSLTYLQEYWQEDNETIEEFRDRVNTCVKEATSANGEPNNIEVELREPRSKIVTARLISIPHKIA